MSRAVSARRSSARKRLISSRSVRLGTACSNAWRCQRPSRAGEMPCARATSVCRAPAATQRTHPALKASVYFWRVVDNPLGCSFSVIDKRKLRLRIIRFRYTTSVPKHVRKCVEASYDGTKRRTDSKAHLAVDNLGHLLCVFSTPVKEQERAQVGEICRQVQEVTGQSVQGGFGVQLDCLAAGLSYRAGRPGHLAGMVAGQGGLLRGQQLVGIAQRHGRHRPQT